jgi:hypothetical protein
VKRAAAKCISVAFFAVRMQLAHLELADFVSQGLTRPGPAT